MIYYLILLIFILFIVWWYWTREREHERKLKRVYQEDALKYIFHQNDHGHPALFDGMKGSLGMNGTHLTHIINDLQSRGLIRISEQGMELTESGRKLVIEIVRAHRIWETFLQRETDLPLDKIHDHADRKEHELRGEKLNALDAHLGFPKIDPHGDPIPTEDGHVSVREGRVLNEWQEGQEGRISHIEDEPVPLARDIFNRGFRVNDRVKILKNTDQGMQVEHNDKSQYLDALTAMNIQLQPIERKEVPPKRTLNDLKPAEQGRIIYISERLQGLARRRLLDLGFTPGVPVKKVLVSSFGGDPTAYEVRGAKIALRKDQAKYIYIN